MKTVLRVAGVLAWGAITGTSWANSPDAAPLPAVETIVQRAFERAKKELDNDAAFKANYSFKRSKTTEYKNVRGHVTKRKSKTSINEPSVQLVEQDSELITSAGISTNKISSDSSQHKRELLANTNILNRFAFELKGKEAVEGRSVFVVDFKPSSKQLPIRDLKERCLSKVAGRVWVDENEFVIVKAEARLTESIGVVGGLVASVHKFDFSFGRERTEDGLWYTHLLKWHLEMRELIVERKIDCVETKTEVRKVN